MSYEVALFESLEMLPNIFFMSYKTVQFPLCWPHFLEVKIQIYIILNGLSFYRLNCAVDGMIDFSITIALCTFN